MADPFDRQLAAKWRQLEQLQAAFATVVAEQWRPSPEREEDTAALDLIEIERVVPPAL